MDEKESGNESDCTSDQFDPLSALYSDSAAVPFPEAKVYDNVAVFESYLKRSSSPSTQSKAISSASLSTAKLAETETRTQTTRHPIPATHTGPVAIPTNRKEAILAMGIKQTTVERKTKRIKNVFNMIKGDYYQGPLSMLTKCIGESLQVKVCTRNKHQIRGFCKGYIVAFDKHMNLAMVDVDETYRNPLWQSKSSRRRRQKAEEKKELTSQVSKMEGISDTDEELPPPSATELIQPDSDRISLKSQSHLKATEVKTNKPLNYVSQPKELTRHVNQLFIRGDTIVTVIPIK